MTEIDEQANPWWGPDDWDAPMTEAARHIPTPVGEKCMWCDETIVEGDYGTDMYGFMAVDQPPELLHQHRECGLRGVLGGLKHQRGECSCHSPDGDNDPPDGMTRREEALELWQMLLAGDLSLG